MSSTARTGSPILQVKDLRTGFRTDQGEVIAVDGVSFDLYPGDALGIVGESGCGKSVTSKSIMRLLPEFTGFIDKRSEVICDGQDLLKLKEKEMQKVRGNKIAMIFQEPMTALNPVFTIGWQLEETLKYHTSFNKQERRDRVIEMLQLVDIPNPARRVHEYPHQLSGGMRQRIVIAMALCCEPDILIADEPTTALDVTIQAQILRLMDDLRHRTQTAIILITHDLGVVAQMCERVMVMYAGQVVESASVRDIFYSPKHPYTRALLESIPRPGVVGHQQKLPVIPGMVPSLRNLPPGCRFSNRCKFCQPDCKENLPPLESDGESRSYRCFYPLTPDGNPTGVHPARSS